MNQYVQYHAQSESYDCDVCSGWETVRKEEAEQHQFRHLMLAIWEISAELRELRELIMVMKS